MAKFDAEYSQQAVPMTQRNNFWKTLSVMLGFTFFSASMLAGGQLGLSLTFTQFIAIVLVGNLALGSGLGFAHITKLPKKLFVIVNGLIGTIFAMWMYNNFVGFLNVLSAAIPSIGAILIADYFFVKRGNYKELSQMIFQSINWVAILAWAIGVAFAQLAPGIVPLNALLGTAIVYIILTKVFKQSEKLVEASAK